MTNEQLIQLAFALSPIVVALINNWPGNGKGSNKA